MKYWKCPRRRMHKRTWAVLLRARYHCLVDRGADPFSFFFFSLFFSFLFLIFFLLFSTLTSEKMQRNQNKRLIDWLWQAETKFLYSVHNPVQIFRCSYTIYFNWLTVRPVDWVPDVPGPPGSPRVCRNQGLSCSLIQLCIIWEPSHQEDNCQHRFAKSFHIVIKENILNKSTCWLLN